MTIIFLSYFSFKVAKSIWYKPRNITKQLKLQEIKGDMNITNN